MQENRVTTKENLFKVLVLFDRGKRKYFTFTATYFLLQRTNNLAQLRKFFIDLYIFDLFVFLCSVDRKDFILC
jgi:hypothetical protein